MPRDDTRYTSTYATNQAVLESKIALMRKKNPDEYEDLSTTDLSNIVRISMIRELKDTIKQLTETNQPHEAEQSQTKLNALLTDIKGEIDTIQSEIRREEDPENLQSLEDMIKIRNEMK